MVTRLLSTLTLKEQKSDYTIFWLYIQVFLSLPVPNLASRWICYTFPMAELKTQKTKASVNAYLDSVPDEQRRADGKKLLKIFKDATGLKPVMWGTAIIGFGQYHYKSERSRQEGDWPLTGFSPRKANLTVYIMPGFKQYGALLKKLGKHKISGGSCIYINKLSDIDVPTLSTIIKKSVAEMKKKHKIQ